MQVKMTTINDLPDEILLTIFKHLPAEDVSMTVPLVNHRWRALSQTASLWNHLTFTPLINMSDEQVARALQTMPRLKSFRLQHGEDVDLIVDTLCQYCPDIRDIVMDRKRGPSTTRLLKLLTQYTKIERLDVTVPGGSFQVDYAKLYKTSNFSGASLIFLDESRRLERIFGKLHGPSVFNKPTYEDILRLLSEKKDILRYLVICSKAISTLPNMICECKELRCLFLYVKHWDFTKLDSMTLTKVQNLECLQVYTNRCKLRGSFTAGNEMLRLVKLEVVITDPFPNSSIGGLFDKCPNLQHIKLQFEFLKDECFMHINKCPRLKHIDISFCSLLTDRTVKYIADGCAELQFLDISYCTNMTDGIINTIRSLKHILELRIGHWSGFERLRSIPLSLPGLCILRCHWSPDNVLAKLKAEFPNLKFTTSLDPLFSY